MANIRFFRLLILFFIGAGVLSSDVLAMTKEEQGMQDVETWLQENYIKKGATQISDKETLKKFQNNVATQMGIFRSKINETLMKHGCEQVKIGKDESVVKEGQDLSNVDTSKHCGPKYLNGCPEGQKCYLVQSSGMVPGTMVSASSRFCQCSDPESKPWGGQEVALGSSSCATKEMKSGAGFSSSTRTTNLDGSVTEKYVDPLADLASIVADCVSDMWHGKVSTGECIQAILGNSFSWAYFADETLDPDKCPGVTPEERVAVKEEAVRLDQYIGQLGYMEDLMGANGEIWELCTEDSKGRPVCSYILVNTAEGTVTSINGVMQGCKPLPFKLYEAKSCLFCPLFKIIYNTIQMASTEAYDLLAIPLARILLIGLAIWIALMVLRNVSALTEQKAPQFLTQLFASSFKVVIVYFLLTNSSIIYNMIIGPLLKAGFDFGLSFLDKASEYATKCQSATSSSAKGVLPSYVYTHLMCFIESVNYELATVQAIGSSMMCISQNAARGNVMMIARIIPDFEMLVEGAIVWTTAFILVIAFSFYLIDAVIQLGIFGMILPFLLMCYPFKITQKYFSSGIGVFMNSWFIFVFMGLVTNVCVKLVGESLTNGQGGFSAVEAAMNGNDIVTLKKLLDIGSAGIVILIACCVFAIKLMSKVTELAGKFSGGGLNLGIGNKLGGLGASGVVNTAKWGAGKAGSAFKGVTEAKIWGEDGEERSIMDKVRGARHKAARAVGKGIGGAFHVTGKVLASPVRFTKGLFKGKNRRTPPVP